MEVAMKTEAKNHDVLWFVGTGVVIGAGALLLGALGNPPNMGICGACFIRDIAGALGLQSAATVQYLRPEIPGFLLGACALSLFRRDWKSQGNSATLSYLFIAFFVMLGALVFLGCSLRLMLRLGGGDLNALVGLAGFAGGIGIGSIFIRKGFLLGTNEKQRASNGMILPVLAVVFLIFLFARPAFLHFSEQGPGSMHAPAVISLVVAFVIGALVQKSGLCTSGGIRNIFLIRNATMFWGYFAIFAVSLIGNLAMGNFKLGFQGQPIAHTDFAFNFLGMVLVGYGSVLIGGCPLRQIIMAGEGNANAGAAVVGFLIAGAVAHNFNIAASPNGVPLNGKIAVIAGLVALTLFALSHTGKKASA
jgi:YedE family putative selenium metabolism protein